MIILMLYLLVVVGLDLTELVIGMANSLENYGVLPVHIIKSLPSQFCITFLEVFCETAAISSLILQPSDH